MEIVIILSSISFFVFFGIAIGLLIDIRLFLTQIYHNIHELETKFHYIPSYNAKTLNLKLLRLRLKKIVQGIRSINPNVD